MPNQYPSGEKLRDISVIDARLAELEQEKQQLIALREELQKIQASGSGNGIAGFRIAPERTQFKLSDTMSASIFI